MKKIIFLFMLIVLVISCSTKEKKNTFSQIIDYCELKENHDVSYCKLGVHHKTVDEIKNKYGEPIISYEETILSLDTAIYENGAYTEKILAVLFSCLKKQNIPKILCHTWNLGKDSLLDEDIWLRIFFVEDEMKKYRAIYGEKARERFFYYE